MSITLSCRSCKKKLTHACTACASAAKDARVRELEAEIERLKAEIGRLIDCGQSIYLALPLFKNGEPKWVTHAREQSFSCSQQQYPPELPYSINRKTQAGQEGKP